MNNQYGLRLTISYKKSDDVLSFEVAKLRDRHRIKTTYGDPGVVRQHVKQWQNNYFMACKSKKVVFILDFNYNLQSKSSFVSHTINDKFI